MKKIFIILFFVLFAIACDGENKTVQPDKTGEENFPCFPNDTCNKGLECVDDICVRLSNDTENSDAEESNDDFTDDIQELDNEEIPDVEESNDDFTDDIQEDDSDAVELDNEEIPDEVEDDTPTPDIYNCFNDDRYFYHNGDCWLKEENVKQYTSEFCSQYINQYDFSELHQIFIDECYKLDGRLPTVIDFRKNILEEDYDLNDIKIGGRCDIYDEFAGDYFNEYCYGNIISDLSRYYYPLYKNIYIYQAITNISFDFKSGGRYYSNFYIFFYIDKLIEKDNITSHEKQFGIGGYDRRMNPNLTCIKNLTEL